MNFTDDGESRTDERAWEAREQEQARERREIVHAQVQHQRNAREDEPCAS